MKGWNMILAADIKGGIGLRNDLPWRIPQDLKHFQMLTKGTADQESVVLMGRNTWQSIPEKFRPLKGRVNVVITNTLESENFVKCSSLEAAIAYINENHKDAAKWIIGGATLYNRGLKENLIDEVYLTRVQGDYNCDTYVKDLYKILGADYRLETSPKFDSKEAIGESGIKYAFERYVKNS